MTELAPTDRGGPLPAQSSAAGALGASGFRPFFLLAGAFAALILPVWLLTLAGVLGPARYFDPVVWHAHEMIFGFAIAVFAGFLLTAVTNWTKRETLVGMPLIAVCGLWALGRVALAVAGSLPRGLPAVVDLAFLPVLVVALSRPIVASRNRRNFVMIAALTLIWLLDVAIHLEALGMLSGASRRAVPLALDVVVLLMIVMTGRIVPMFTKNATGGDQAVRGQPALDKAALAAMVVTALLGVAGTDARLGGCAALLTAILLAVRSTTWGTARTARVPLLWILHAGHAWIAIGLALRGMAAFTPLIPSAVATHALTVGAVGSLTVGMMSRVALGHTGRALVASRAVTLSFALITLAAIVRVVGPLVDMAAYRMTLFASGVLWTAAFVIFVVVHAPLLVAPRPDGERG